VLAEAEGALVCAVTLFEAIDVYGRQGFDPARLREQFERLGMIMTPFGAEEAMIACMLPRQVGRRDLSLGDRCCLGLAVAQQRPVLTAARDWSELDLPIDIRLIR
jgi:ribonuclease VapC